MPDLATRVFLHCLTSAYPGIGLAAGERRSGSTCPWLCLEPLWQMDCKKPQENSAHCPLLRCWSAAAMPLRMAQMQDHSQRWLVLPILAIADLYSCGLEPLRHCNPEDLQVG